jgi:hypothetical protein
VEYLAASTNCAVKLKSAHGFVSLYYVRTADRVTVSSYSRKLMCKRETRGNERCVWLESRGSGAEPTLILGTAPTPLKFGSVSWVADELVPTFVWMKEPKIRDG